MTMRKNTSLFLITLAFAMAFLFTGCGTVSLGKPGGDW